MNKVQKDLYPEFLESLDWPSITRAGNRILVALSGGPDSIALCDLIERAGDETGSSVFTAHLNHGLRGDEADSDENFVREFCSVRGIPLDVETTDVASICTGTGQSIEMAARTARYSFLGRVAAKHGISVIAIGHNANDRIETFFMRMLRGSGGKGLGSLQPVRHLGGITFIRPLLGFSRNRIIEYLDYRDISYITDSTNLDTSTDRGRLRNVLIPKFIETASGLGWESVTESLSRSIILLSEDEAMFQEIVETHLSHVSIDEGDAIHFNASLLSGLPSPILGRIILAAIERMDPGLRPERTHINRVVDLLKSGDRSRFDIPGGFRVDVSGDNVVIRIPPPVAQSPGPVEINLDNLPVTIEFGKNRLEFILIKIPKDRTQTGVEPSHDGIRIAVPEGCGSLVTRAVEPGDRMKPLGMSGHSKKISDIFVDRKVSMQLRHLQPLIVDGSNGEILAVPGLKIVSDTAKLTVDSNFAVEIYTSCT